MIQPQVQKWGGGQLLIAGLLSSGTAYVPNCLRSTTLYMEVTNLQAKSFPRECSLNTSKCLKIVTQYALHWKEVPELCVKEAQSIGRIGTQGAHSPQYMTLCFLRGEKWHALTFSLLHCCQRCKYLSCSPLRLSNQAEAQAAL